MDDLRGKAVASHGIYLERLRERYGVAAIDHPFNNGSDLMRMTEAVASGVLAAAVDDEPAMLFYAAQSPGCKVTVLPDTLTPFDYGIAFKQGNPHVWWARWSWLPRGCAGSWASTARGGAAAAAAAWRRKPGCTAAS